MTRTGRPKGSADRKPGTRKPRSYEAKMVIAGAHRMWCYLCGEAHPYHEPDR